MIEWSLVFTILSCAASFFLIQFVIDHGQQRRWACMFLYLFSFASTLESFLRNFMVYVQ